MDSHEETSEETSLISHFQQTTSTATAIGNELQMSEIVENADGNSSTQGTELVEVPDELNNNYNVHCIEKFQTKLNTKITEFGLYWPQIIRIQSQNPVDTFILLSKYIDKSENRYIFSFEASNKMSFYVKLYEVGIVYHFLNINKGLIENFEEIVLNKLSIESGGNCIFILYNYNDEVGIEEMMKILGIVWILVNEKWQQKSTKLLQVVEKMKISKEKIFGKKFQRVRYINMGNFGLKLSEKFRQSFKLPENFDSILVPQTFIGDVGTAKEKLFSKKGSILENKEMYKIKSVDIYNLLASIVSTRNGESEVIEWIDKICEDKEINRNILPFIDILLASCFVAIYKIPKTERNVQFGIGYTTWYVKLLKLMEKVEKWPNYFVNKDIISEYFVSFCKYLIPLDMETFDYNYIAALIKFTNHVGVIYSNFDPSISIQIYENILGYLKRDPKSENFILLFSEAKCFLKSGHVGKALCSLKTLLKFLERKFIQDTIYIISLKSSIAQNYIKCGNSEKGIEILEQNLTEIENSGQLTNLEFGGLTILRLIGKYKWDQGDFAGALEKFEKIRQLQIEYGDNAQGHYIILWAIFRLNLHLGQFEKSVGVFEAIYNIYNIYGKKFSLDDLCLFYETEEKWASNKEFTKLSQDFEYFLKILCFDNEEFKESSIIETLNIDNFEALIKVIKTKIQQYKRQFIVPELTNTEKLAIREKISNNLDVKEHLQEAKQTDKIKMAEIQQWIGHCYTYQGESEEALKTYKLAEELLKNCPKQGLNLGFNYLSRCELNYNLCKPSDISVHYLKEAYKEFEACEYDRGKNFVLDKAVDILGPVNGKMRIILNW